MKQQLADLPKPVALLATPPAIRSYKWQVALCSAWFILCAKIAIGSLRRLNAESLYSFSHEAFLFYTPLFMVAFMVWLWGVNVCVFLHSRVNYPRVFDLDHNHLAHWDLWRTATVLAGITLTSLTSHLYFFSRESLHTFAVMQPILLYSVVLLLVALPLEVLYVSSRLYFLNTVWRLFLPLKPVTFADFFLADVLTSMAKVISALERSICRMSNYPTAMIVDRITSKRLDDVCGADSLWVPGILAVPYFCRLLQCLRQYSDTKEKNCLFNALKYATAFPVIFLSAAHYKYPDLWVGTYKPLWITFAAINSCYSFYWDMTRDWDLEVFGGKWKGKSFPLRSTLLYNKRWVYYWAIATNLLLRISWTYKHSAHLDHIYRTVLFSALEMLRRFQWIFFRVEAENIRMTIRSSELAMDLTSEHSLGLLVENHDM